MTLRTARTLAGAYLVLMLVGVTWPGMLPFSRAEPFILGLPFSMAWIAGWVAGSVVVMALLDRVERRSRDSGSPPSSRSTPRPGSAPRPEAKS